MKELGHEASSPHPPTFNVDNHVIFALFVGKNAIFRGEGGYVILLLAGIVVTDL